MRRRFGRGRRSRGSGESRNAPIDAARWLARIAELGVVPARELEPVQVEDIPASFAALGAGESEAGVPLVVAFAPRSGGDAALAAVAYARRRASEQGFDGEVVAVAPQWSIASRRRLGLLTAAPFKFRALAASALAEGENTVELGESLEAGVLSVQQAAAYVVSSTDREIFLRALAALEGLAAKHGGAVRGAADGVELVLLARRAAALRASESGVVLDAYLADRFTVTLEADTLATSMDRLEGQLRKRLADRRTRSGEEGLRAALLPALVSAGGVRTWTPWPLGGSDPEVLDLAGLREDGRSVVAAAREQVTLPALASILDALLTLRPALPALFARADTPVRLGVPRLVLAGSRFDDSALHALSALSLERALYDVRQRRGRDPVLESRGEPETPRVQAEPQRAAAGAAESEAPSAPQRAPQAAEPAQRKQPRFEEISLFDLDDERQPARASAGEESTRRRSRRGGRRRGRRTRGAPEGARGAPEERGEAPAVESRHGNSHRRMPRGRPRAQTEAEPVRAAPTDADELDDLSETLAPLATDAPEPEAQPEPAYDDEEEFAGEAESERDRLHRERERRRRARIAKAAPEPQPEAAPRPPRRRAAIVAHADRASLVAAILLARDVRLLAGFWIYPQAELMTFFRSVATDRAEEAPIHLVGFTATPARDTIQAAALYRERLDWYDHHEWPPEDLEGLREAIGSENVHVCPGTESSLPAVLGVRTRRSRFSDKLVELVTGRFSQHDYERWGRLWWQRLQEIAGRSGDRRADVEPLLVGRPSDLALEAAAVPSPPVPPEVEYVSKLDFRLVHFGGYVLVVVPVSAELDLHLAARVARGRYAAELSLAFYEGGELFVLGADDVRGRRELDLGAMVDHLGAKHDWADALSDEDHVARVRIQRFAEHPERLEELIGDIAMGRSILEG